MVDVFETHGGSVIAVQEVPDAEVEQYGIVGGEQAADGVVTPQHAGREAEARRRAVAACDRRALRADAGDLRRLERTAPGKGREIQITDALSLR